MMDTFRYTVEEAAFHPDWDNRPIVEITPRPYQVNLLREINKTIDRGNKRMAVVSPTGSGKTVIAALLSRDLIAQGHRIVFVCDRINLTNQSFSAFAKMGLRVGFLRAEQSHESLTCDILVTTSQTAKRRMEKYPEIFEDCSVAIVDECHYVHNFVKTLAEDPDRLIIGLTATPESPHMKPIFEELISHESCSIKSLLDAGMLAPVRILVPCEPDRSKLQWDAKAESGMGGYSQKSSMAAMQELQVPILDSYRKHCQGNGPTIVFACSIRHAESLRDAFLAAGITAATVVAGTPLPERDELFEKFEDGRIDVLVSVLALGVGFDSPKCCNVIIAKPTSSMGMWIQMIGRGRRLDPSNPDKVCTVLDCGGIAQDLGSPDSYQPAYLPTEKPQRPSSSKSKPTELKVVKCKACDEALEPGSLQCECGHVRVRVNPVRELDGVLIELSDDQADLEIAEAKALAERAEAFKDKRLRWYCGLLWYAADKGFKPGWAFYKYQDYFGSNLPAEVSRQAKPVEDAEVSKWVKGQQANYHIRRNYRKSF